MRIFILIGITCFIFSCKAQNTDFNTYLSNFKNVELPLKVDRKTYNNTFYYSNGYSEISENWLKRYVCIDTLICLINPIEYRYDFGVKFNVNDKYNAVLIHKQKYEGDSVYDFDLSEIILTIYTEDGSIISQKIIGKDNDGWISNIDIKKNKIITEQIKILEFNKVESNCEIELKEYVIDNDGVIKNILTNSKRKGIVYWDNEAENFIIK